MAADPILDPRDTEDFYRQAQMLAEAYCPQWTRYWPESLDSAAVERDPGIAMLNLFSLLGKYLADVENGIPGQRRLAFYQFLDLKLQPPAAARVPLTFSLRAGRPPRLVPARTAVLDGPTQKIRFETLDPLLVVPADLAAALTVIPAQDQWVDALPRLGVGTSVPMFTTAEDDPSEAAIGHWFLLGDPSLFRPDTALQRIRFRLEGRNLHPSYFEQWVDGALRPLRAVAVGASDGLSLEIELIDMPKAPAIGIAALQRRLYSADGGSGDPEASEAAADDGDIFWLGVKPAPPQRILAALERQLPVITRIGCVVGGAGIPAQQAVTNEVPWDVANGGYPFTQTPAPNDSFYLRSDSIFAKTGALVTLTFDLRPVDPPQPAAVVWEYWDGSRWASLNRTAGDSSLHQFTDSTDSLQGNSFGLPTAIGFVCPAIEPTTVAGSKGRWIRAVLTEGRFGSTGGYATDPVAKTIDQVPGHILDDTKKAALITYLTEIAGVGFSFHFEPASYAAPFVEGVRLSYRLASRPTRFWSYNGFALTRFLFSPYKPPAEACAAFHLGFDPAAFLEHSRGRTLSLLFHLEEKPGDGDFSSTWQYFDGRDWQKLEVDDGTRGLTRSGLVRFTVPDGISAASLFSRSLCWFRIVDASGRGEVRLRGLYPNSVEAVNAVGVSEDILGSATGEPFQTFALSRSPVLPRLALDVIEPQGLEPKNEGPLTVTPPDTSSTGSGRARRRWNQVDTFAFQGPADRAYTLDTANGLITFGDGRNGMVPPPGHDNVIAASFDYTDGLAGNVDAGALTVLRPGISDITAVGNPVPAAGGADGDRRADISRRGPAEVRARHRAVDSADLAALAEAASPEVARAAVLVAPGPEIRVLVLPRSDRPRPAPEQALLDRVRGRIAQACLAPLVPRLSVAGVRYAPVDVTVQVAATVPAGQRLAFQQELAERLTGFLHPVFGGAGGDGWGIGETVRASAFVALLRQERAVTAVRGLALNDRPFADVEIGEGQVAAAGTVSVYVYAEQAAA
jgi:hypothetical protein